MKKIQIKRNKKSEIYYKKSLRKMIKTNCFTKNVINKVVNKFLKITKNDYLKEFKRQFGIEIDKKIINDKIKELYKQNYLLITNLKNKYNLDMETITNENKLFLNQEQTINQLKKQEQITGKRAEFIARDQASKSLQVLDMIAFDKAGIEYYIWNTAHDERVSTGKGGHKQLDGKIYKLHETDESRKPIIDSYGNRGLPSQRPNCRCNMLAVFLEDNETIEYNKKSRKYEIIKKK